MNNNLTFNTEKQYLKQILNFITKPSISEILSENLLEAFDDMNTICNCSFELLLHIDGMTERIANFLINLPKFCNLIEKSNKKESTQNVILNKFGKLISNLDHEKLIFVSLNSNNEIIETKTFVGNINSVVFDLHTLSKFVNTSQKSKIFILHNHPSGNVTPSIYDIVQTKNVILALNVLGLSLKEHYIVSKDKFFSFNESQILSLIRALHFNEKNLCAEILNSNYITSRIPIEFEKLKDYGFNYEDKFLIACSNLIAECLPSKRNYKF
ncbi:MAG: hypothetical protein IJW82_04420 [Clostridia bacterium]|nr:hypothetical protein [Clostridia bacterium]